MTTKAPTFCDGCDTQLSGTSENFCKLSFSVIRSSYVDAAGSPDFNEINMVFCSNCAKNMLLPALDILAAKAKRKK